ncbi:MAG: hypothetical protein ACLGIB_04610 [Actinomycetota bacterium]
MRKALKLKKFLGIVALVSLMTLGSASTVLGAEVAGGKQANSACTLEPQVTKNEPGICASQPIGSVATQKSPASPTSSPGFDPMWIAVAAASFAALAVAGGFSLFRHRPHPIA